MGNYKGVLSCFNGSVVVWTGHNKSSFVRPPGVIARWLIVSHNCTVKTGASGVTDGSLQGLGW